MSVQTLEVGDIAFSGSIATEVAGQKLHIFAESPPMIEALVRDIYSARSRVWIEVYIILEDDAGKAVAAALAERAKAGLDVRLLYDAIGSFATPTRFFSELEAAGVKVVAHHSLTKAIFGGSFRKTLQILNRRNHRKVVVIDELVGYFGGMNIVDQSTDTSGNMKDLPKSAGWRDVHLRLEGPQQSDLAESFERSWRRALHKRNRKRPRSYRKGALPKESEFIRFFDSGPGPRQGRAALVFSQVIRNAKKRVLISMAYFIPTGKVLRALLRAPRDRVRVQVVVPGESDVKLVEWATQHLFRKLLRCGIEMYERQRRMLHSKVMVADGEWTVVGSANMDPRSFQINYELLAVIRSKPFAAAITSICEHEIQESTRVTKAQLEGFSFWQRWRNRLAYSLRWGL